MKPSNNCTTLLVLWPIYIMTYIVLYIYLFSHSMQNASISVGPGVVVVVGRGGGGEVYKTIKHLQYTFCIMIYIYILSRYKKIINISSIILIWVINIIYWWMALLIKNCTTLLLLLPIHCLDKRKSSIHHQIQITNISRLPVSTV